MRKRYLRLGLILATLVAGAIAYIGVGAGLYSHYRLEYATYQIAPAGPCGALVAWSPPRVLYTAFYPNQPALVTIRYRAPSPQTLRISVGIPHFTQQQSVEVQAVPAFQEHVFKPPLLDSDVLDALVGPDQRDEQIRLVIQSSTGTVCDISASLRLMSRLWMHWYDPAAGDNSRYLAGWITPQAHSVAELVGRTAQWLAEHPGSYPGTTTLSGYDAGRASAQDVRNQVNALFDTLQSVYHVHYAQDNVPFDRDERIQLPQDILTSAAPTGMCVETTDILASAVERLGMRPYVIIVPGHAFLGIALGTDESAPIEYWETSDLNGGVSGSQANVHGDAEYSMYQRAGQVLRVINVQYERQRGIEPIE